MARLEFTVNGFTQSFHTHTTQWLRFEERRRVRRFALIYSSYPRESRIFWLLIKANLRACRDNRDLLRPHTRIEWLIF